MDVVKNGRVKNQYINAADNRRGVMVRSLAEWLERYPDGQLTGPPENFFTPIFRMSTQEGGFFRSLDVGVIEGGAVLVQSTSVEGGRPMFHFEIRRDLELEPVIYTGQNGRTADGWRLRVKPIWKRIWEAVKCFS